MVDSANFIEFGGPLSFLAGDVDFCLLALFSCISFDSPVSSIYMNRSWTIYKRYVAACCFAV